MDIKSPTKEILEIIQGLILAFDNRTGSLHYIFGHSDYNRNSLRTSYYRLEKNQSIQVQKIKNKFKVSLTDKGIRRLMDYKIDLSFKNRKKLKKDWYIVIFDIPNTKKSARDYFRYKLKQMKFKKLQKSIWYSQYDFYKELFYIINNLKLNKFVSIIKGKVIANF